MHPVSDGKFWKFTEGVTSVPDSLTMFYFVLKKGATNLLEDWADLPCTIPQKFPPVSPDWFHTNRIWK
jgi:hypothetical protein